ncbi:hypothetical protein WJX73_009705 [Symbiochloris irregularis]|uniref:Uncharacterized protein n=1 Tax=Symbiochloris irregularis TaxID=706552 RepID=A0AAW1NNL6_9CHLO
MLIGPGDFPLLHWLHLMHKSEHRQVHVSLLRRIVIYRWCIWLQERLTPFPTEAAMRRRQLCLPDLPASHRQSTGKDDQRELARMLSTVKKSEQCRCSNAAYAVYGEEQAYTDTFFLRLWPAAEVMDRVMQRGSPKAPSSEGLQQALTGNENPTPGSLQQVRAREHAEKMQKGADQID